MIEIIKNIFFQPAVFFLVSFKHSFAFSEGVFGMTLLYFRAALLQNSRWSNSITEFRLLSHNQVAATGK
jgi:hypothetical protein